MKIINNFVSFFVVISFGIYSQQKRRVKFNDQQCIISPTSYQRFSMSSKSQAHNVLEWCQQLYNERLKDKTADEFTYKTINTQPQKNVNK